MKSALLALSLFVCTVAAHAQRLDPLAPIKTYAAKVLPRCPEGVVTVEPLDGGPANFQAFVASVRSSDQYCGTQKYLLYSPKSGQVVVGSVVPLAAADARPLHVRVAEKATELLKHPTKALVSPFPLPDGLKSVSITRETPWGPFSYQGFIDQKEQFMIIGMRGNLSTDPTKTLREALGVANGARRGTATAVEVLELSDFQCPTCARAHEKLEPIIKQNLSKLNYVRLDLPLFEHHQWSIPAALGARAIQRVAPAKYWDYVDYVFKNQEAIGKRKFDDVLKEYLEDNDIDAAAVNKIYASKTERQALLDQVSRAFSLGIASTPTFIVNGQVMGFGPDGTFTIDQIRAAAGIKATAAKAPAKKK